MTLLIAVSVAALAVGLRHSTSAGYLGIALSQLVGLSQSLINLLLAWTRVENGIVAVERVMEIRDLEPEEKAGTDGSSKQRPEGEWPQRGAITFKDVSLRYRYAEQFRPDSRSP
jgi:ATP-binding cassette subfamily C (CFTR/MRP) protein 1